MISFGPIPSRRLGKSLGINNIPSLKICPYSCIYCQVGLTKKLSITREPFYEPEVIFREVQTHLSKLNESEKPDYLTFVANGEPTLDINLEKSITRLKAFQIPIAVITNGTMLGHPQVRKALCLADWVSLKVDTTDEEIWKKMNRPIDRINFTRHLENFKTFVAEYNGKLMTETMLVQGVNDQREALYQTAQFISQLNPDIAYLSIPTRPPALSMVKAPDERVLNEVYQIFAASINKVELLLGFEGVNAGHTGNAIEDIINICTVHPIREDTMMEILSNDHADHTLIDSLIKREYIKKVQYNQHNFYIRQFHT